MATQKILTLTEVAELLQVHPITVYRLIKAGKLPAFRIGRVLRFDADQLENWLLLKQQKAEARNGRRKPKGAASAEYVAYPSRRTLSSRNYWRRSRSAVHCWSNLFLEAKETAGNKLICARCGEVHKPVAALLLFASEQAKRHWKQAAMPFCRTCFAQLRKLAAPEAGGRSALASASKTDRKQAGRVGPRSR